MAEIEVSIKGLDGENFFIDIPFCEPGEVKASVLIKLNEMKYITKYIELKEQETGIYVIKCDLFAACKETFGDYPDKLNLNELLYNERNIDNCRMLINLGANINFNSGYTTIEHACKRDNVEKVRLLVSLDANFEKNNAKTLLHIAAEYESIETAKYLLDGIFDIKVVNRSYENPVMVASIHDNYEMINFLFENGATHDPDIYGYTPIFNAVIQDNISSVAALIELGATNSVFEEENTLFHIAGERAGNDVLEILMEAFPAEIYNRNNNKETIMHIAIRENNESILKLLAETEGETPLTMAMRTGKKSMVRILLESQHKLNGAVYASFYYR